MIVVSLQGGSRKRENSVFVEATRNDPGLAGRFELNGRLAIHFGEAGYMGVDFLERHAKVTVEIDGAQHFHDQECYRRDRYKDVLLQKHGFFVLRCLAEDVGKRLGEVLDRIKRALAHRGGLIAQSE